MKCPYCGTDNPVGEDFCTNCGGFLDPSANDATVSSGSANSPTVVGSTPLATNVTSGAVSGSLRPNARLQNGRYVVEKVLGQGGMGAAVLVRDTRVSNKKMVIKELISDNSDPVQRQDDVRNFEREVETLANLDHPLIPTVTDSFQEASRYYMVQEYAAGENLEDYMERLKKPMPELEALTYATQVLDILNYLSEQSPPIVHRDIKPANIIVSAKDHRARLVDFGIARADVAKNAKHKQTSALGTPGYAPPEQYQGNADARSDLYALAATLHHVVTNRDPRDYPPFNYPPARTLNPQLSLEIERVLARALQINPAQRYQSAAAMKHEVDEILSNHFHAPNDTSSYTLSSGYMSATRPNASPTPAPANRQGYPAHVGSAYNPQATPTPPPPPPPFVQPVNRSGNSASRQAGAFSSTPASARKKRAGYFLPSLILLVVVVVVLGAALIIPSLHHNAANKSTVPSQASTPTLPATTIGVTTIKGEQIGISDGSIAFDTNRKDGSLKQQAAAQLSGDHSSAKNLWQSGLNQDPSDAEALIYLQDLQVQDSGNPFVTIVVPTILSGANINVGQDDLQGAYVAQKEYNANNGALLGGVQVRLLIANVGSSSNGSQAVANQILQLVKTDSTVVGTMGWPYSSHVENVYPLLNRAHIPFVSPSASADDLTGVSPYFFRIAPSNLTQAQVGAKYAYDKLNARHVLVFADPSDAYSRGLAQGFQAQFSKSSGTSATQISYKRDNLPSVSSSLSQALKADSHFDLIYFAGYASDASALLTDLPNYSSMSNVPVLGGDGLYELNGYSDKARASSAFTRLRFTGFAYPDEWGLLANGAPQPAFFTDYSSDFNPDGSHSGYGYTRFTDSVMLSYDSMVTILTGCKNGLNGQKTLTPTALQQGLTQITGSKAIQGVSGQISFTNGDPANKAVLILTYDNQDHLHLQDLGAGKFLVGQ